MSTEKSSKLRKLGREVAVICESNFRFSRYAFDYRE